MTKDQVKELLRKTFVHYNLDEFSGGSMRLEHVSYYGYFEALDYYRDFLDVIQGSGWASTLEQSHSLVDVSTYRIQTIVRVYPARNVT